MDPISYFQDCNESSYLIASPRSLFLLEKTEDVSKVHPINLLFQLRRPRVTPSGLEI